ncbi:MAG: cytochrome c4, partial [Planctomycetota bacterium]
MTLLLVAATMGQFATVRAAEPATKADTAEQIVAKVCSACHTSDGNSVTPANPVLAGQHAEYTAKQLANFKSGERKNPVMLGMASTLAPEDMKKLGEYFQQQKTKPRSAKDPELVKVGQQIYRGGIMAKGIAACTSCHGANGGGIPAQYPRIAGQHADAIGEIGAYRVIQQLVQADDAHQSETQREADRHQKINAGHAEAEDNARNQQLGVDHRRSPPAASA